MATVCACCSACSWSAAKMMMTSNPRMMWLRRMTIPPVGVSTSAGATFRKRRAQAERREISDGAPGQKQCRLACRRRDVGLGALDFATLAPQAVLAGLAHERAIVDGGSVGAGAGGILTLHGRRRARPCYLAESEANPDARLPSCRPRRRKPRLRLRAR